MFKFLSKREWYRIENKLLDLEHEIRRLRIDTFGHCTKCASPAAFKSVASGQPFCGHLCEAEYMLRHRHNGKSLGL